MNHQNLLHQKPCTAIKQPPPCHAITQNGEYTGPMWKISRPKGAKIIGSLDYKEGSIIAPSNPFYIADDDGIVLANGFCSERMSPLPLWSFGMLNGGSTIWYLNHSTFMYERFEPHRERGL